MISRCLRIVFAIALIVILSNPLAAVDFPRGTLWRVVQTCVLNQRATGSPFPCLDVDLGGGYAVLRAPFRQTHVVTMPIVPIVGVEAPALYRSGGPNYFQDAWMARHFVQAELKRPLARDDIGLAINSRLTRSQDQLHIHVDCLDQRVKRMLADRLPATPIGTWLPGGFVFSGQSYWSRRLQATDLSGTDVFTLANEIPDIRSHPNRTILAVAGVGTEAGGGFVLLAGQSNPRRAGFQSTAEDLLDHDCQRN